MSQLLSSISKKKTLLSFVFLFLIIGGMIIPQISHADWNPLCYEWLWGKKSVKNSDYCFYSKANNAAVVNTLSEPLKATFSALILAVATIIVAVVGTLATLASSLVRIVMNGSTSMCYTCFANPAIAAGWPMVRDLANMFIVLGFVIIGIATTLRLNEYGARKLLPKLIIVALLINFSLVICGVFIDGSNIAMTYFTKSGGYLETAVVDNISNQASAIWSKWDMNNATGTIGNAVGIAFYDIILFVVFMLFFFLFLFRYIALWILVILSPLAFVCYVFPFTKRFFDMWWSNFLGWCIIGIPAGLFMWISDKIAATFITPPAGSTADMSVLGYLVPCAFLIAGFLISLQTSAMGASAAIGAAKWSGNMATGAVGGTGRMLDKATGGRISSARQAISGATGRTLERIGLRPTGAATTANNERVDKAAKTMASEYAAAKATGDMATQNRIRTWARTERGTRGAAAMKVVSDAKDLHRAFEDGHGGMNLPAAAARLQYAESVGAKDIIKDNEKLMPGLGAHNQAAINEEVRRRGDGGAFVHPDEGREVVRRKHAAMTVSDMRNLPESQINNEFLEDANARTFDRASLEFTTEQIDRARGLVADYQTNPNNPLRQRRQQLQTDIQTAQAAGNAAEADRLRHQRTNLGANILTIRNWH